MNIILVAFGKPSASSGRHYTGTYKKRRTNESSVRQRWEATGTYFVLSNKVSVYAIAYDWEGWILKACYTRTALSKLIMVIYTTHESKGSQ